MPFNDFYIAIGLGVVLSLVISEFLGISPAGLIVPGYVALLGRPIDAILLLIISFLTYIVVSQLLGRITILYGKRKFAAMILIALLLRLIIDYSFLSIEAQHFAGVGAVVPGLIANSLDKQGFFTTLLPLAATTVVVALTLSIF